ncbi:uncharacterized protein LOC111290488 isoform X2 [Durio zibethinus]|nr:uncharacterized protein LOC111290488 isoform X2 [Durio zibethinus]XP_022737551.1 uncharacterized protein LOC111290488 isoform X2 [Durio zibethinus]XP_022737552.1 uncharacterized protein LOC111290488 isoform X2 [Durio zibethinus]XP_022737553.1 uncharacterized protein LOC111290488 isoform X2 [Durio zibethinus]
MGLFIAEKGFVGAQFPSSKLGLKEESGTFNTCAPSCSPCVHSEQMATKTNGFSGEACQRKESKRCSFNDADLSSPRINSACNDRNHPSSETSHPLSACLSCESVSENAKSDETLRDCNTSEGTKMIIKPNLLQTCANNCGSLKEPIFHDKVVSNQLEKLKESECLGDNISFICRSDCAKTRASDHNGDADKKNTSYSSASVDSFSETEKAVNGQPASCLVGSPCGKVDDNHPRRSNRSSNESSQEILCCSNKSDFSEISSLRDSCAGASSAKGEHSECSEEQVQSRFARADALQVGNRIGDEHNSAESIQVDTGINERAQKAEVQSTTVAKEVNMEETTIESRPAACSDESDSIEYEVKVCDICGDIGREELLAVCSRCNDGAEHIYCMRVKMENVPKGDWMCEECMLSKETEKQKQDKLEGEVRLLKKSYTLESETKGLEIEESKEHKVISTPLFSSKRPAGSLEAVRKRPFGTVLRSPSSSSSCSKTSIHQSGGHFSSTTIKSVHIPTESSNKSPKLSSQSQVSKGFLFKSKSFSAMGLKEDVQLLKDSSLRNEGFAKETTASESKGRAQMMSKSMSLKNLRSYSMNNSNHDIKLLPNFSRGEDLKRSRHPKGQNPTKTEKKPKLANSNSFASVAEERIASPGKNSLPHPSSSSCHDLMAVKDQKISDNSLKISGHSAQGGSPNEEKKRVVNVKQHVEYSTEMVPATNYSNANAHSDERPCLRDSSVFAFEVHMPSWISAVPQLDFIWQGKFEIQRSGGFPLSCDGMQAHLSTYASHEVLEVVQTLPQKLLLAEAPRLSMWPSQFIKSHATEDNIALYFFAKDLDSYERSYKNLLDRMIKDDFSLKGNFGGVELLIFSSNLLPEKSQRWNNLLFLWGVFRGKRSHCSGQIPAVSASENLLPPGKSSQSISASPVSCNTHKTLNSNTLLDSKAVTSGMMVEVCETKASSWEQKPLDLQTSCSQQVGRVGSFQREKSESKRRPEIDLNYSLQESEEYSADYMEFDGRHDCKKLKSCPGEMNIGNNSIKDINERRSIAINGKGPSISGELSCNGAYDMSIVSPQLASAAGNMHRWKSSLQPQVLSNDSGNPQDPSVSGLELKLGIERSSSEQGNTPPKIFILMGSEDLQDQNSERETSGDTNPSLALSLALPSSKTGGRGLKLDSEMNLPTCPEVNTTLSLFGASLES